MERRTIQPRPALKRPRRRTDNNFSGPRPDLVAAWAVALGIFLILVASATSQGATDTQSTGGAQAPAASGSGSAPAATDDMTRNALESLRARLGLTADVASASSQREIVRRMRFQRATWYGPGLYGHRTACGIKLRPWTVGVAHRRLPCGTRVTFYRGGAFKTVPVIDRGPFSHGANWDLTSAAAKALDFRATGRLRVIH